MFIYLIVNHETGKYYVGQHKGQSLKKYLQQKFHHAKTGISEHSRLFRSMRAHPDPSVWSIHALRSDIQTKPELDQTEKDFIKFLRSQDPDYGYNICRGGEGFTGPHAQKSKKEIGLASTKRWKQLGAKENLSTKLTGGGGFTGPHSQETREKMIKSAKKRWNKVGVKEDFQTRVWVVNQQLSKSARIYPKELNSYLKRGWVQGRGFISIKPR